MGLEASKYNETRYNKVISTVTHKVKTHKTSRLMCKSKTERQPI